MDYAIEQWINGPAGSIPPLDAVMKVAIATVAVLVRPRLGAVAVVLACLVAYSRVYLGAHYPSDVLGGAVVGIAVGIVIMRVWALPPRKLTEVTDVIMTRLRLLRR